MVFIKDILDQIELFAPLTLQESYDNAGVQIGSSEQEAKAALVCLDVTEEVIDEAIQLECNLILAHHPLAFHAFKSLTGKNYIERCMLKACKNDLVIYAAHTNLDNAMGGVSFKMATMLGLTDTHFLCPMPKGEGGSGVIGKLPKELTEKEFLLQLKQTFDVASVKHTVGTGRKVKKIALCSGSGAFMIKDALAAKADVFITGEAKYNDFFDVENLMLLAVIGHYESEVCTKNLFHDIISKKFPTFALHFSNVNSNPIKYL
ncbi:MAG: Nif3-like dinuclear metal center hexameric protein [Massilibacteroides sp.]|nr:Nif3-like dinuclear metal center hexameric protein [Massilibacteroides sp.]